MFRAKPVLCEDLRFYGLDSMFLNILLIRPNFIFRNIKDYHVPKDSMFVNQVSDYLL